MKKSRFSEEQMALALRQADSGTPVGDVCRLGEITDGAGVTGHRAERRMSCLLYTSPSPRD